MKNYPYHGRKNICGNRVREARKKRGMTQVDLAAQLQVAEIILEQDGVSRIESGRRFVADYELKALAKILRVDMLWLVSEDDEDI